MGDGRGVQGENIEEIYEKGKGEVVWRCRVDETRIIIHLFPSWIPSFIFLLRSFSYSTQRNCLEQNSHSFDSWTILDHQNNFISLDQSVISKVRTLIYILLITLIANIQLNLFI
jgi:hypothetical protein